MLEVVRSLPEAIGLSGVEKEAFLRAAGRALGIATSEMYPREKWTPIFPQRIHFGADALPPFAGRQKELSLLHRLVRNRQSVLISGLGGVGKTRLAQEVLRSSAGYFAHGCEYLTLMPGQGTSQIMRNVAQLLGVSLPTGATTGDGNRLLLTRLREQLRDVDLLFMLDNVERADQVRDLVWGVPSITWVITARRASLRSIGVYPLHLELPSPDDVAAILAAHASGGAHAGDLTEWTGGALFIQAVNDASGRLPIAIRLVAMMIANGVITTPGEMDAWLQAGGLFRAGVHGGKLVRLFKQLLDAVPAEARELYAVCGVFSTRIIRTASVNEVCRRAGLNPSPVLWDWLADFSLIDALNEEQVQLHPLLHHYARVRLANSSRFDVVSEAYKAYYLELALSVSDSRLETQREYWRLAQEELNLLQVAKLFHRERDWSRLKALWPALSGYLWNVGNHAGYETFDQQCLEAARAMADLEWEAIILSELGFVCLGRHDWEEASELFRRSQAIHDAMPNHVLEQARLRRYRALLAMRRGELEQALVWLDECEAHLSRLTDPPESRLAMALVLLYSAKMSAHFRRGDLERAVAAGMAADHHYRSIATDKGHRLDEYRLELGDVLYLSGVFAAARELWVDCLRRHDEMHLPGQAEAQLRLAWLAARDGDPTAARLALAARDTFARFGLEERAGRVEAWRRAMGSGDVMPAFDELIAGSIYPAY